MSKHERPVSGRFMNLCGGLIEHADMDGTRFYNARAERRYRAKEAKKAIKRLRRRERRKKNAATA